MAKDKTPTKFDFDDKHFQRIVRLVSGFAGIHLAAHKTSLAYNRLSRAIRSRKMHSFDEYLDFVEASAEDKEVITEFVNAITTNLTSFFRENHHFIALKDEILPGIEKRNSAKKVVNIWCCASSTGEEPYSIAIECYRYFKYKKDWKVNILATDIDTNVLNTAKAGVYNLENSNIGIAELNEFFLKGTGGKEGSIKIKPFLQEMIKFEKFNLMNKRPSNEMYDLIFCRNVTIYFDEETKEKVNRMLLSHLYDGCYLIIGNSESIRNPSLPLKHVGKTMYVKTT